MIRLATQDDMSDLCTIISTSVDRLRSNGIYQWDNLYPSRSIIETDISMGVLYVIQDSNSISPVGLITLDEDQDTSYEAIDWSDDGAPLVVHRLTIHPEHHGKGLASQMMLFAENRASSLGYTSIRLDAFMENKIACTLYERRGYVCHGTFKNRMGLFNCYEKVM